ncbi:MAG: cyclic nucleotide-binding domain-containing protein [Polyangiaceae bacterium]|nr:cyclic nucleotide-binding domain-containing protein [Polyangiaceae bacterium]
MDLLTPHLNEHNVAAGTVLFREGDLPKHTYFTQRGSVSLTSASGAAPVEVHGTWILGGVESAVDMPRFRTATVLTPTRILTVPASVWHELFEDSFEISRSVFFRTLHALGALYSRLSDHALEFPASGFGCEVPDQELDAVERLLVFASTGRFALAGTQTLTDLAQNADEVVFAAGAELFRSAAPRGHVVLSGELVARRNGFQGEVRVGPGAFVLPLGVTGPGSDWTVRAEVPSRTLAISLESLLDEMEEHPDLVRSMLRSMWEEREWLLRQIPAPSGIVSVSAALTPSLSSWFG